MDTQRDEHAPRKGMLFSSRIDLSHVASTIGVIVTLASMAVIGYQTIEKQIDLQTSEVQLLKQRLTSDETTASDLRDSMRVAASETRAQLSKIIDQIADLRALVAAQDARRR